MKHTRAICDGKCGEPYGCNLCNLFLCSVCLGAEGSLTTDCPGVRMTEEQEKSVYAGQRDYREGKGWCTPDGTGTSMGDTDIKVGYVKTKTYADYSNFSWEAIQKSLKEMVENIQRTTGATDEQMAEALSASAKKFMDTNFLKEPK